MQFAAPDSSNSAGKIAPNASTANPPPNHPSSQTLADARQRTHSINPTSPPCCSASPASDSGSHVHQAAPPPPRRPKSASPHSSQNVAIAAASTHSASHSDLHPTLPSDECTTGCQPSAVQAESVPPTVIPALPSKFHRQRASRPPTPPAARE